MVDAKLVEIHGEHQARLSKQQHTGARPLKFLKDGSVTT